MKRFKGIAALITIVAIIGFVSTDNLFAKGFSSSSSSSRSSFSSSSRSSSSSYSKPSLPSSSSGYSKPTTNTWSQRHGDGVISKPSTSSGYNKPGTTPTKKDSGYSKPGTTPATTPQKATFTSKSTFDKNATATIQKQKSAESLNAYKAEQNKFKGPKADSFDKNKYADNGLYKNAPVYSGYNAKNQIERRDNYYKGSGYTPPPYVYNTSPSFGVFDTMFLFWMMNSMSHNRDAQMMAHNYQKDPGFQEWRKEADKMAQNNTELKAKLDTMDKKLEEVKAQPIDPKFVPKGIPADVIVSPQAMQAKTPAKPDLTFVTGKEGGVYDLFGKTLKTNVTGINVKLTETSGSMENLKLLLTGQADMALVQSDTLASVGASTLASEQTELYPEFMQLIVNKSSGVKSIADLDKNYTVLFPKGSGSAVSWDAICNTETQYKAVTVAYVESYSAGLDRVAKDPKAVMFLVSGLNSPILKKADKMGNLRLAEVYDNKLLNRVDPKGNKIYSYYTIDKNTYPNLQYRWYWNKSINTLAVNAVLVLRTAWVKQYGTEAFDALTLAVLETRTEITRNIAK